MKKAELALTQAWQNESKALMALAPLSAAYGAISRARKALYQSGVISTYQAPVPVLIIGNITVGGSGKTPLIIALLKILMQQDAQVGVISRGYGGDASSMPRLVLPDSMPDQVGDEPCLIVQSVYASTGKQVPMAVGADRKAAIELLLHHHPKIRLIISDDGLQHYALHRDLEWIVVDAARGFGNQKLLPQGFLREPISRLEGATVIYHDKAEAAYSDDALVMTLQPSALEPLMSDCHQMPPQSGSRVYAVSGIGHPQRFFDTLGSLGFEVLPQPFGDHHEFKLADLMAFDELPMIITAKDAVKIRSLAVQHPEYSALFERIWVLPVEARFSEALLAAIEALKLRYQI